VQDRDVVSRDPNKKTHMAYQTVQFSMTLRCFLQSCSIWQYFYWHGACHEVPVRQFSLLLTLPATARVIRRKSRAYL